MSSVYNEEKKVAFIHVHKCAGYAIYRSLFHMSDHQGSGWSDIPNDEHAHEIMRTTDEDLGGNFRNAAHFRALDMKKYLGAEKYEGFSTFACVRDPWQRLYSWYRFLRKNEKKGRHHELVRNWEFDEFVQFSTDHFYHPQYQWLVDESDQVIVNQIIQFENLSEEWSLFSEKTIGQELKLPVLNKSKMVVRSDDFAKVRRSTLLKFRDRYAQDFELLGYDNSIPDCEEIQNQAIAKAIMEEIDNSKDTAQTLENHGISSEVYELQRKLNSAQDYGRYIQQKFDYKSMQSNQYYKQLNHLRKHVSNLKNKSDVQKKQIDRLSGRKASVEWSK